MINIYKKTNKNKNNMYGFKEITSIDELNNPFLLCISNNLQNNKSIFGMMRDGAHAARIHTTKEKAANYNIEKVPIDFIGIKYNKDKETVEQELLDKLVYPYLIKNGKEYEKLFKQARNINVLTFDLGTTIYLNLEKLLYNKLKELKFSKKDIENILKQISLVSLGSKEKLDKTYSTTVSFIDTNDKYCSTKEFKNYQKVMIEKNIDSMYFYSGKNNTMLYPFISTGEHYSKKYLADYSPAKVPISSTISNNLYNSIYSNKHNTLEMSRDLNIDQLFYYGSNIYSREEQINLLDQTINYEDSIKYTEEESDLRTDLDSAYKKIILQDQLIDSYKKEIKTKDHRLELLLKEIKNHCNEKKYHEILLAAKLIQDKNNNK